MFFIGLYLLPSVCYFFSIKNNLTDFNAKKFVSDFSSNDLVIHNLISEERRNVYQQVKKNRNRHFRHLFIGSSRIMQFGKYTGFNNAINLGVSGATYEDINFIFNYCIENNITYDTIHFDFNPWLAQKNIDYRYKQFMFTHNLLMAVKDVLKFNYGLSDLKTVLGANSMNYSILSVKPSVCNSHIKFMDGSIKQATNDKGKAMEATQNFVKRFYKMDKLYKIDYEYLNRSILLFKLASKNSKCIVYLTPFHYDFFEQNSGDKRVLKIIEIERYLIKNATEFTIKGSFNPSNLDIKHDDFIDGFHIYEDAIVRLIRH